ncbi:MAG TPA: class I SAM-dependent methyltransferase [Acidimicrobiales bacterium]|nr:class I SAM-dependent methyltransferase [Acidimicrobiales bacterium]
MRPRPLTRHAPWAIATAGIVANSLRLRARLTQLAVLDDFLAGNGVTELPGAFDDDFELVTAEGVTVDDTTLRAAVRYARFHDLDVVDLVPADLPVADLLELMRLVNPKTYRDDPMVAGRGAGHATLVRSTLLPRVHLPRTADLDPVEYVEAMVQLKNYAPTTSDLVVAPRLTAVTPDVGWRLPRLKAIYGPPMPAFGGAPTAVAAAVTVGPKASRIWGTAALAAYVAQPFVATIRLAVKPRDLRVHTALGRPARQVADMVRALRAIPPPAVEARAERDAEQAAAQREEYARMLDDPARLFEPRRVTCPWCGSDELQGLIDVPDMLQRKPGQFHLDECRECDHVFQNPRLSLEGLDVYYKDFYDGLGENDTAFSFSMGGRSYLQRALMLAGVAQPKRWLDVGAGHGHFCLCAREVWPETRFDGLDLSDSVVEAQRRGWVEHGYKGMFPDMADDLVGAYDVVSMHHYLEHTRDPEAELDAAGTVLERGGHLLIEVPDPESRLGRRLGPLWGPWFQPQHQHFVSAGNLTEALQQRGFTVVAVERAEAHQTVDLAFAMWLLARRVAPAGSQPWAPPLTPARRAARTATFAAFAPFMVAALVADQAIAPLLRRLPRMTNTYRILARRS